MRKYIFTAMAVAALLVATVFFLDLAIRLYMTDSQWYSYFDSVRINVNIFWSRVASIAVSFAAMIFCAGMTEE